MAFSSRTTRALCAFVALLLVFSPASYLAQSAESAESRDAAVEPEADKEEPKLDNMEIVQMATENLEKTIDSVEKGTPASSLTDQERDMINVVKKQISVMAKAKNVDEGDTSLTPEQICGNELVPRMLQRTSDFLRTQTHLRGSVHGSEDLINSKIGQKSGAEPVAVVGEAVADAIEAGVDVKPTKEENQALEVMMLDGVSDSLKPASAQSLKTVAESAEQMRDLMPNLYNAFKKEHSEDVLNKSVPALAAVVDTLKGSDSFKPLSLDDGEKDEFKKCVERVKARRGEA